MVHQNRRTACQKACEFFRSYRKNSIPHWKNWSLLDRMSKWFLAFLQETVKFFSSVNVEKLEKYLRKREFQKRSFNSSTKTTSSNGVLGSGDAPSLLRKESMIGERNLMDLYWAGAATCYFLFYLIQLIQSLPKSWFEEQKNKNSEKQQSSVPVYSWLCSTKINVLEKKSKTWDFNCGNNCCPF